MLSILGPVDGVRQIVVVGPANGKRRDDPDEPDAIGYSEPRRGRRRSLDVFDGDLREVILVRGKRSERGVVREEHRLAFAMLECQYQDWNVLRQEFGDPCEESCLDR
jgi:hypothetical protein